MQAHARPHASVWARMLWARMHVRKAMRTPVHVCACAAHMPCARCPYIVACICARVCRMDQSDGSSWRASVLLL
jgi:hypothetical protein